MEPLYLIRLWHFVIDYALVDNFEKRVVTVGYAFWKPIDACFP